MGGMGEEEVYKESLMEEAKEEVVEAAPEVCKVSRKPEAKEQVEEPAAVVEEVEEEAADVADPFDMMGGMVEEEIYKVSLIPEKKDDADSDEDWGYQDQEKAEKEKTDEEERIMAE